MVKQSIVKYDLDGNELKYLLSVSETRVIYRYSVLIQELSGKIPDDVRLVDYRGVAEDLLKMEKSNLLKKAIAFRVRK